MGNLAVWSDRVLGSFKVSRLEFLWWKGCGGENAAIWLGIPSKQVIIKTHGFHLVTKENETGKNNTNHCCSVKTFCIERLLTFDICIFCSVALIGNHLIYNKWVCVHQFCHSKAFPYFASFMDFVANYNLSSRDDLISPQYGCGGSVVN